MCQDPNSLDFPVPPQSRGTVGRGQRLPALGQNVLWEQQVRLPRLSTDGFYLPTPKRKREIQVDKGARSMLEVPRFILHGCRMLSMACGRQGPRFGAEAWILVPVPHSPVCEPALLSEPRFRSYKTS